MSKIEGPVLGIPDIDAQHADMLKRAADVAEAARARRDRETAVLLEGFMEATALHFACEEELMEQTAYPDLGAHRSAHDLFLQDLHASSVEVGKSGVTPRVAEWATSRFQQWIRYHIEVNDRPLARHVLRKRAPAPRRPPLRKS